MRPFKVGDKVFSLSNGVGVITSISEDEHPQSIEVDIGFYYTVEGRQYLKDVHPTLFHLDEAMDKFPWCFEKKSDEKKKVLLAPAIYKEFRYEHYCLTRSLFSSLEDARNNISADIVHWPAIPNADGYYEVYE